MPMFRLQDLPEHLRVQAEAQLAPRPKRGGGSPCVSPNPPIRQSVNPSIGQSVNPPILVPYSPSASVSPPARLDRGSPNKTELDYNISVLHGLGRFEPVVFRLPGGNYTPDWMTIDDGIPTFHEVKGSYRFGSESRAHLAFLSAAAAFPFFRFVWAQKQKGGKWITKLAVNIDPDHSSQSKMEATNG